MAEHTWTVLVVEAEQPAQGLLARCLDEDYRVLTANANCGRAAVELIKSDEVDLVLCNQLLPDMTGVEFFSRIRIASPEAIRVLLTECRDPDEVIRSINEAAVCQIISPDHLEGVADRPASPARSARSGEPGVGKAAPIP